MDELPWSETRETARARLKLSKSERVLLLMPGSRPAELALHLELTGATVRRFVEQTGEAWTVLLPLSSEADRPAVDEWALSLPGVRISVGNAHDCMLAADLGLVKSGTSTLEAALLGCPHVLFYRPHWITAFLFHRVLGYRKAVGLVNWIAGRSEPPFLVPEAVSERATPEILALELATLWRSGRPAMREAFAGIRGALRTEESPSRHAAREIWKLYFDRRHRAGAEAGTR